jgi:hypothetical protein
MQLKVDRTSLVKCSYAALPAKCDEEKRMRRFGWIDGGEILQCLNVVIG